MVAHTRTLDFEVAFDIVQTARSDGPDLVVMGYPEEHPDVTETVEYESPCDVVFLSGMDDPDLSVVNVGAGGGPHHLAALPLVRSLRESGSQVHVIGVSPTGEGGTAELAGETVDALSGIDVRTHAVTTGSVAEGLVSTAAENGGILLVGASRTRRIRQWVFWSTPDRVVELADEAGVLVLIYASELGISGWFEDWLFPLYRYLRRTVRTSKRRPVTETEEGSPRPDRTDTDGEG